MKNLNPMKKQLLTFALAAMFFNLIFIPQVALAQSGRIWGTYYYGKGSGGDENDRATGGIATDAAGNVYIAGRTSSTNNIAFGGFQNTYGGGTSNAFLAKFDANGNRIWATYYGGTIYTNSGAVVVDADGNVYLAGVTQDTIAIASGGFQNTYGGGEGNVYLVKFDANGNRLWATYYGGTIGTGFGFFGGGSNAGNICLATDAAGDVYMGGTTIDTIGIASGGFQNTFGGGGFFGGDAFLVKFDASGNRLWGTYYGGSGIDGATSVAIDATGNVYLAGMTGSLNNITWHGFQNTFYFQSGESSAFLVKFDANGNRIWGTYYGTWNTNESTIAFGVTTDFLGNVYLAGNTSSSTGIASKGFQNTIGVDNFGAAFLVKFDSSCNRLWGTYYGGGGPSSSGRNTSGQCVVSDAAGNVWMAGDTEDTTGIAFNGFLNTYKGGIGSKSANTYLVEFDPGGIRQCATYYGESYGDIHVDTLAGAADANAVALDIAGNVYMGISTSDTADIASGGFQNVYHGDGNINRHTISALIKFTSCTIVLPVANFQSSDSTFCANDCINYTDMSTNTTSWQWSFPGGTPSSSTMQNPQGICYYAPGTFDSKLIASNSSGESDTLNFTNHIKVFATPPTPVIRQHQDTLFCTTDPVYTSYQWYDSTTLIPGATDTFLVVTHGGNYNVAVSNEFGCKISVGITIAHNVGINEFSTNNYISLSPNPASTQLIIHSSSFINWQKATVTIVNVLGQEALPYSLSLGEGGGEAVLTISNLPAGMYFLQIKTENGTATKRFVKQ